MNSITQPSVLVVDDDPYSTDLARLTLTHLGFTEVKVACNGRDGLRALEAMPLPPDFLLCDIFMPDMDGIEFSEELAKRRYAGGVILISGGDVQMLALAKQIALESGLNVLGALTKPLQQVELSKAFAAATHPWRSSP